MNNSTEQDKGIEMDERERHLKTIEFREPDRIPCNISLPPATWHKYKEELEKIVLGHPGLFSYYKKDDFKKMELSRAHQKGKWKDVWGIVWENIEEGLDSAPVEEEAPLRDWENLESYQMPDPLLFDWFGEEIDWEERKAQLKQAKKGGNLARGSLIHGFMYMWLYYLRGFTNLMMDIASRDPRLNQLIEMVLNYNLKLVNKWIKIGAEIIYFGDDLGLQNSLPISPSDWRGYLKPCYAKIFDTCRDKGVHVYLHTDGHILEIIEDLIKCRVSVLNPQWRGNGIDQIAKLCKGKVCVDIDLDRQKVLPYGNFKEIGDHVREAVIKLGSKRGGLMLTAGVYPDVPLGNIEALCQATEEYSIYYS